MWTRVGDNRVLFMSPLKPPQPCGRPCAWCFVNVPRHLIRTTIRSGNCYSVVPSLTFLPLYYGLQVGISILPSHGLMRNQRDIIWWEAFVTWRALNKSSALDIVVHHVIADNPSGFSWLCLPRLQIGWWSKPCCLLFSAHVFPLDDFICLMIPITIYLLDVRMGPDCVRSSSWMPLRHILLGRPTVTTSPSLPGLFLLHGPLAQSLTPYLPDTVPCLWFWEVVLALAACLHLHRPVHLYAWVTAKAP